MTISILDYQVKLSLGGKCSLFLGCRHVINHIFTKLSIRKVNEMVNENNHKFLLADLSTLCIEKEEECEGHYNGKERKRLTVACGKNAILQLSDCILFSLVQKCMCF